MRRLLLPSIALAACILTTSPADAKIAFIPLDQRVANADFVGIVECETAGAVVATYKVIESCRGAKAGERINIRTFVRSPGPQFRISLVGERYLAIARRAAPHGGFTARDSMLSPIAWRQLHADYEIPYGQGPSLVEPDTPKTYQQAKKLVAAQFKGEFQLPKPDGPVVWTAPPRPTPAQLNAWRRIVADGTKTIRDPEFAAARWGLYAYEPTPFFKELLTWEPPETRIVVPSRVEKFHSKASFVAWRCAEDRQKHLKMLLDAKEPIVRATGAVYLCFENEKLGKQELAKLAKLDDEAGSWAALTLARRGDKNAVPRVLQLFHGKAHLDSPGSSRFETALRLNAMVLLSNSAHKSGVPQPPVGKRHEVDAKTLHDWWDMHAAKIALHDPWLETLSKQKID